MYNRIAHQNVEVFVKPQYLTELDIVVELIQGSGELARRLFYSNEFKVYDKGGSKVTNIDFAVHEYVIGAAKKRGLRVRSEEAGSTAKYGENRVLDLDPIDNTDDLDQGYQRQPRRSNAAPSLEFWDKEPVAGAVIFPLLGVAPITYMASKGGGAYREQSGRKVQLKIDTAPMRGIVFVSSRVHKPETQAVISALRKMEYTPVPEHGAVFKACGVADMELLRQYPYHAARNLALPVVGYISHKTHLHDIAATTCIVQEAGGVTTSPRNQEGKQLWVAANNKTVYADLMRVGGTIKVSN